MNDRTRPRGRGRIAPEKREFKPLDATVTLRLGDIFKDINEIYFHATDMSLPQATKLDPKTPGYQDLSDPKARNELVAYMLGVGAGLARKVRRGELVRRESALANDPDLEDPGPRLGSQGDGLPAELRTPDMHIRRVP